MRLLSPAFREGEMIPSRYTCDGDDINPELRFVDVPKETKSLALIVDDPDSPTGIWLHWSLWNIAGEIKGIAEDSVPRGAVEGETDFSEIGYGGPCPGHGQHHYRFTLYALDALLTIPEGATRNVLEAAIKHHILAQATLSGRYQRVKVREREAVVAR